PRTPREAGISIDVIRNFAGRIPILGICLGHQCIASAFGGSIGSAKRLMHGKTSPILHDQGTVFRGLSSPFEAMRYHSLAIERSTLPACLEISAWTSDGEIMGVRHRKHVIEGVQFHPESVLTVEGKRLLRNFLELRGAPE
ncbi:MAG TPA: aminodeoxychorismate/anthranilate synthase component II, partial [Candidatus Acidoferrales bacterium]|nr:aminodeoxychorismate/anthranilate synthase component II [Candidatus Acidoferrales bacterium]